jgi:hypothetical protein
LAAKRVMADAHHGAQQFAAFPSKPSGWFIPYVYAAPSYTIIATPFGALRIPLPFRTILLHSLISIVLIFVAHRIVQNIFQRRAAPSTNS